MEEVEQEALVKGRSEELDKQERQILVEYHSTLAQEEKMWRQKSRVTWIREGDRNTKFFKLTTLRSYNRIEQIRKVNGTVITEEDDIKMEATSFYENLLSKDQRDSNQATAVVTQSIPCLVNQSHNDMLQRMATEKEVKSGLFLMEANKAPSLDGFPAGFFQKNWEIVGKDVWYAVKEFFSKGKLLKQWNNTFLTLIPKSSEAKDFKD